LSIAAALSRFDGLALGFGRRLGVGALGRILRELGRVAARRLGARAGQRADEHGGAQERGDRDRAQERRGLGNLAAER
jgi:hypothetical protein